MKRAGKPTLSATGHIALTDYATVLREQVDARAATVRNYLSDLRQFMAWCEQIWAAGGDEELPFTPGAVTTPLITRYRAHLQQGPQLKPASINRALLSIKRYLAWATETRRVPRNVAAPVKRIPYTLSAPRHLTDREEEALLVAVTACGSVRDRTLITLMLHTGLRAEEVCTLRREHVTLGKRSGVLRVYGKRNRYREIPLNATARTVVDGYMATLPTETATLFPSEKTGQALTGRAIGYLVTRYAQQARLTDLSPHDLRHRFGYRMAAVVPLHRLAQIMGHDSLDTTLRYVRGTPQDLQAEVEKIAWE